MLSLSFHSECLRKERQQPPSVQDLVETPYGISPYTYSQTQVSPQAGYGNPYMQQPSQAPNGEHYTQPHAVASRPPRYVLHWGNYPILVIYLFLGGNEGIFNVILIYYIRHINPISSYGKNGYHGMAEEIESTTTLDAETEWTVERY